MVIVMALFPFPPWLTVRACVLWSDGVAVPSIVRADGATVNWLVLPLVTVIVIGVVIVAALPYRSSACTSAVMVPPLPPRWNVAAAQLAALPPATQPASVSEAGAAPVTVTVADPVFDDPSVAVSVCWPASVRGTVSDGVLRPFWKLTLPAGSVGAVAFGLLVGPDQVIGCLLRLYEVTVLPLASCAVSVTAAAVPAVTGPATCTPYWARVPAVMSKEFALAGEVRDASVALDAVSW